MLLVGTAISMLTAVLATRAFLAVLAGLEMLDSPRLMGAAGGGIPSWLKIDYIGKRRTWFAVSGAVVVISLGALAVKGLNLGIDFKGGTQVSFTTPQPVSIQDVRTAAAQIGEGGAQIQGLGPATGGDRYRDFQLRTEALEPAQATQLRNELTQSVDAVDFGATTVSASFGEQIARSAILAILFSLALIVIYIAIRFHWKFAVPVIVALLHDVAITIGVYSVTGRLMTSATVAAILTVLGYSIYDTIIIFDRIRENIPLMRRASIQSIANVSLWEVMRRSLATTFITLLPVTALFFFGGETLKDFAFALIVGIGIGAYSSIFIAAPLLSMLKEREPEFARRLETVTMEDAETAAVEGVAVGGDGSGPAPAPIPAQVEPKAASKRERRQQRRRTRPHGRAR
jgi:SecD/SecF fusion protein